ncbi:hypothetical protein [Winogradskyella alexanderae]|uniref:YhhN-like protein n=1 Tax=Winogradskyella alexanderae TaxID=2877123 RepID=A0ABS7XSS0_9FLAO|nr:hypothetical protein [Winogradskyella alexanderae]MCA0133068.1 hypothetical protein [Winogradskyella alexanderae]
MIIGKILKVLLLLLAGVYIVFKGIAFEIEGDATSALAMLLLTLLYGIWTPRKNIYFLWFLILHTAGLIVGYFSWYGPDLYVGDTDYFYYTSNSLFILSYFVITLKFLRQLDFKSVFSQLSGPIFILIVLDIFCVSLVTATAVSTLNIYEYTLEYVYNGIIMVFLSVTLINYMYRNDTKSMMLLIGSISVVFSEIIQLTYYYVLQNNILVFVYSFLLVIAFIFLYKQSQIQFTGPEPEYTEEQLGA